MRTAFDDTFATLRNILRRHAKRLMVSTDRPGDYQLSSREMTDRTGRPLFVAAVQIRKSYVSFHLMPVYACPDLVKSLSPGVRKRMQSKACFNFKEIEPAHAEELSELTKKGLEQFQKLKLPWAWRTVIHRSSPEIA